MVKYKWCGINSTCRPLHRSAADESFPADSAESSGSGEGLTLNLLNLLPVYSPTHHTSPSSPSTVLMVNYFLFFLPGELVSKSDFQMFSPLGGVS